MNKVFLCSQMVTSSNTLSLLGKHTQHRRTVPCRNKEQNWTTLCVFVIVDTFDDNGMLNQWPQETQTTKTFSQAVSICWQEPFGIHEK